MLQNTTCRNSNVALEKHKEELEVKHTNASARLQRRLTKRMSNQEPVGTEEGGEVKVMEPLH